MKTALVSSISVIASASLMATASQDILDKFQQYQIEFNKNYTEEEIPMRFNNFVESLKSVEKLNSEYDDMEFGLNPLSDATPQEREFLFHEGLIDITEHTSAPMIGQTQGFDPRLTKMPRDLDYRKINGKNCASPTRDQNTCGGCWAFAVAAVIEGAWCLKFGELKTVSPQHLIDCDKQQSGCAGGNMITALNFSKGGICPWSSYAYENRQGQCRRSKCSPAQMTGVSQGMRVIPAEAPLVNMLNKNGPVGIAVAYNAHYRYINGYKKGNISAARCNANRETGAGPDHAMTVMGYKWDEQAKHLWFLVRNSYGNDWGQNGYGWMEFGACGWAIYNMDTAQITGTKEQLLKGFAATRFEEGMWDASAEEAELMMPDVPEELIHFEEGMVVPPLEHEERF